jgi:tetratricopeptide (TPR) repeat protein
MVGLLSTPLAQADLAPARYREILTRIEASLRRAPYDNGLWRDHGISLYRTGECAKAIETLQQHFAQQGDEDAAGLATIAMARSRLGERDRARVDLGRATILWKQQRAPDPIASHHGPGPQGSDATRGRWRCRSGSVRDGHCRRSSLEEATAERLMPLTGSFQKGLELRH